MMYSCAARRSLSVYYLAILAVIVCALASRWSFGAEIDGQRQAVVRVGEASGVCISPDGYILTAAHVVARPRQDGWLPAGQSRMTHVPSIAVQFPGRDPQDAVVLKVVDDSQATDLALLKTEGVNLPYLQMANASPSKGADVVSLGYPSGHYARLESKVVLVGQVGTLDMIKTSHRANGGHSGGPLLNADGEVIGICSRGSVDVATPNGIQYTNHYTLWARTESLHQLMASAGVQITQPAVVVTDDPNRPELQVWSTDWCGPCKMFKADRKQGKIVIAGVPLDQAFVVTLHNPEKEPQQAQDLGISDVPVFVTEDGAKLQGYNSPTGLIKFLSTYQRQLAGPPSVVAAPVTPPPEPTASAPEPVAPPVVDDSQGAGLKAIVLVRKQELNMWQAAGVTLLERQAKGLIKTHLTETLGKYAEVDVVFERLTPARFNDLAAIAGMGASKKVGVLVAVRQSYTGAGESIVKYVEERLKTVAKAEWQSATLEVVFERVDQEGYDDLCAAIDRKESDLLSQDVPGGWFTNIVTAFSTLIGGIFTGTRRKLWAG
ncbi:MAG: trypsin-like peptidase domain-containing protein [Planctomycetota bacterium]